MKPVEAFLFIPLVVNGHTTREKEAQDLVNQAIEKVNEYTRTGMSIDKFQISLIKAEINLVARQVALLIEGLKQEEQEHHYIGKLHALNHYIIRIETSGTVTSPPNASLQ